MLKRMGMHRDVMTCDLRLPPQLKLSLPSSGLLRSVRWFLPTFRDYVSIPSSRVKRFGLFGPLKCARYLVPKRRYQTALRCLTPQKTEDDMMWCCFCCSLIIAETVITRPARVSRAVNHDVFMRKIRLREHRRLLIIHTFMDIMHLECVSITAAAGVTPRVYPHVFSLVCVPILNRSQPSVAKNRVGRAAVVFLNAWLNNNSWMHVITETDASFSDRKIRNYSCCYLLHLNVI